MDRLTPARSLVRPPTAANTMNSATKMRPKRHRQDHVHHTSTFETLDIQKMPTTSRTTMPSDIIQPIGVVNIGLT